MLGLGRGTRWAVSQKPTLIQNFFSIYHTGWITSGPKHYFRYPKWRKESFFSLWLLGGEEYFANHLRVDQTAHGKHYFTCVVYTNDGCCIIGYRSAAKGFLSLSFFSCAWVPTCEINIISSKRKILWAYSCAFLTLMHTGILSQDWIPFKPETIVTFNSILGDLVKAQIKKWILL